MSQRCDPGDGVEDKQGKVQGDDRAQEGGAEDHLSE
jgi:hypothetical protein